jgi:hypothetical protein
MLEGDTKAALELGARLAYRMQLKASSLSITRHQNKMERGLIAALKQVAAETRLKGEESAKGADLGVEMARAYVRHIRAPWFSAEHGPQLLPKTSGPAESRTQPC